MKKYKNLENKDRIFLYHKPVKAVWITQIKINLKGPCTCAAAAHSYSLNFQQKQAAFGLKQPTIFQTKNWFYLAVSIKSLLKQFLWFANDQVIIRFHYTALAIHTKLNLLQYLSRQANHLCNKLAFLTILIMEMVAFLGDKSQLFVVLLECVSQAFSPYSYRLPWINNTQKQQ